MARTAHIVRETSESHIDLELNLDGTGKTDIDTSVPFYNHMMTALGKHSLIDLTIHAHGDTDIDVHHTVEDTAIVFGEALKQALGDKKGIRRFADATVPLDEALAKAVVDISGRPYCVCVGEQIMFEHGLEHGAHAAGIGLIGGSVNLLDADVVPHMGWDTIEAAPDSVLLNGVENERFYFVHSYAAMEVKPADTSRFDIDLSDSPERVSWCSYGRSRFVAAYEHGPLSVTQFHPEKSGDAGSQLLKNWIATL